MSRDSAEAALLRSLTWCETLGYAPTRVELLLTQDDGDATNADIEQLLRSGRILAHAGRLVFPETADAILHQMRRRDPLQPRKRRRARRVAAWLARLSGVRYVAIANTTALGYARDEGDLDLFVIVRAGSIWITRLLGALPFRLLGMTPRPGNERDAVCLSYFIADDALDLSAHMLEGDDPYFRHWFLSLLPLFDDGISTRLWDANVSIRSRHPSAQSWIISPDLAVRARRIRIPAPHWLESFARWAQLRWFPRTIRERMNRDSTVIVNDHALKFHVTDGREEYRRIYADACRWRGIEPV